jgi:hypothetical protein
MGCGRHCNAHASVYTKSLSTSVCGGGGTYSAGAATTLSLSCTMNTLDFLNPGITTLHSVVKCMVSNIGTCRKERAKEGGGGRESVSLCGGGKRIQH